MAHTNRVLDTVRSRFLSLLNAIGTFLNQVPDKRGKARTIFSYPLRNRTGQKFRKKDVYGHKGSGYKGKGNINTDTSTFNKLRKQAHQGR